MLNNNSLLPCSTSNHTKFFLPFSLYSSVPSCFHVRKKTSLYFSVPPCLRVKIILLLLCTVLFSCKRKVYDHFVLELTYPDNTREMHSISLDNILVVHYGETQYTVKAKNFFENSVDIEVVASTCVHDTIAQTLNLLKTNQRTDHMVLQEVHPLGGMETDIMASLVRTIEVNKEGEKSQCYSQTGCCASTCYSTICCLGNAICEKESCACGMADDCPQYRKLPTASEFSKLMGKSKLLVKVPMED